MDTLDTTKASTQNWPKMAQQGAAAVRETASELADKTRDTASDLAERAGSELRGMGGDVTASLSELISKRPLLSVGLAFAAGWFFLGGRK